MSSDASTPLSPELQKALASMSGIGSFSSPFTTVGRSGVKHSFTLGMKGATEPIVVCDVFVGSAPLDEIKVLSLFIKVYDVGAQNAVLCAVPSLTDEAKKLSALYKITTVQSTEAAQVPKVLSDALKKITPS